MPEQQDDGIEALSTILDNIDDMNLQPGDVEKTEWLQNFLTDPVLQTLIETNDCLTCEFPQPNSASDYSKQILDEVLYHLDIFTRQYPEVSELVEILQNPYFESLCKTHDDVMSKNYEFQFDESADSTGTFIVQANSVPEDVRPNEAAIRMVGIKKKPNESLGMTVRKNLMGDLVINRVLARSPIDEQGLLHVGDIIKEVNGEEVRDPQQLQDIMRRSGEDITIKVIPAFDEQTGRSQMFVKCHFSYDPKRDNIIPCRDVGLSFKQGEILEVVNMDDDKWWQAKKTDGTEKTGIIPSQQLEEKRKAFVKPDFDNTQKSYLCGIVTKKKKKMMYQSRKNAEFDNCELAIYEEVAQMPPFKRKTLVLIGAQGIGRRTIKQFLLKADPNRFGFVIPHTCRPRRQNEVDGNQYHFMGKEEMEDQINSNEFLEWGAFEGNYYGTKYDSIRNVINKEKKMCVLDINPTALKGIKSAEYMPFIVFLAAPPVQILRNMHEYALQKGKTTKVKTEQDLQLTLSESARIEKLYKPYFDITIVNDNMDETYYKLRKEIDKLSTDVQWVPVSWLY